jgi:hypothetical protein
MTHHPSSAELAAFRRSIAPLDAPWKHPDRPLHTHADGTEHHPGAWPDELRHGIGYRPAHHWQYTATTAHDRREASAMRSRAYALHRVRGAHHGHERSVRMGGPAGRVRSWIPESVTTNGRQCLDTGSLIP